jgi:sugar phosphate isomerase/epimerase
MLKNFSPDALGINGRQSELIELALTYGFRGMDIDMSEMVRRSARTSPEDASKYLKAAEIKVGGFELDIDLESTSEVFTTQVGTLHPMADLAKSLGARCAYIRVPIGFDEGSYPEFFDSQAKRLKQIAEVLAGKDIKLAIGFSAGKELTGKKAVPFIQSAENLIALVRSVGVLGAGVLLDTWDWVVGEGTMQQIASLKVEEITAVRLGSLPSDVQAASATSEDRVLPEKEGAINHVDLIKHLASIGFKGPVSPSASSSRYKGQTRESTVQRAQEAVDGISRDAGLHVAPLPMELIEDIPYEPTPMG